MDNEWIVKQEHTRRQKEGQNFAFITNETNVGKCSLYLQANTSHNIEP